MSTDLKTAFLAGVQDEWHAIEAGPLGACTDHAWSLCGQIVRVAWTAEQFPVPYSPGEPPQSHDPCPACMWEVAARTDTFEAVLATLADPLAHDTAAAILNQASQGLDDDHAQFDDDHALQLLAAVTRHAGVTLAAEDCSDGTCDHGDGECPTARACAACSLQAGPWAGEWEGQYLAECTIPAPCAPLLAIAATYGAAAPAEAAGDPRDHAVMVSRAHLREVVPWILPPSRGGHVSQEAIDALTAAAGVTP